MAWRKAPDGSLEFYENGQEPVRFPVGSLKPETVADIEKEMSDPAGAVAASGAAAEADLGMGPPPGQPVNTIDLNAPPGPPAGQPVNTIDLGDQPRDPGINAIDLNALPPVEPGTTVTTPQPPGMLDQLGRDIGKASKWAITPLGEEDEQKAKQVAEDAKGLPTPQAEIIPAGMERPAAGTTRPRGGGTNPLAGAFREQDRAVAGEKAAIDDISGVKEQRSAEEAGVLQKLDRQISNHEARAQIQRDALATELAGAEKRYADAVETISKMKLDPGRYMSSASVGEKIRLGLAAFVGAIGSALTGQENKALAIIHKKINDDLQLQKDEIMNAKEGANLRNNIVAQLRQKGLSLEQSMTAAKQIMLEGAKRQLDVLAAEYGGPEAKANAELAKKKLDEELADLHVNRTIAAQKAALAALGKKPKTLNEGTAKELGEANAAVKNARKILDSFERSNSEGIKGWLKSKLWNNDTTRYEDNAALATQVIGTYLEGGKLSDANVPEYRKKLPVSRKRPPRTRSTSSCGRSPRGRQSKRKRSPAAATT
jgi:hypothetical protein